ncbi:MULTISPECIES: DUF4179 domain-containing protein [Brevibacillus]|uniref:DUF4179 domain-containing protein n=1 Tax=Brevibacillus TaxID=55080 RepID=UPI000D0EF41E|nr:MULTISPECIES: DUF4179 domain-containing protein [Brevibacillus]PSJ68554.1 DUF4179 domain-containing protein [Brevibacillus brevis]RED34150.1 uncharacterized protein DUF4179 [Brevibacillus brevis]TQK62872.1 uncharacterized protein DUF4179 [Brevibacillus sp. AG162]VEF92280.1 Uncharacterised protein [Brevibacillus brevis]GEC93165.1 hypothetical protein BBR01nite_54960 [Brevibacillus brevis]
MTNEERQIQETLRKVAGAVEIPSFQMPCQNNALQVRRRPFYRSKKWTSIGIASAVVLGLLGTMQVSPTFAAYVKSIFAQDGFDEGVQQAARQGFSETSNLSVTDQGITLEVKEIIADSAQVMVALMIKQSDGKQLLPTYPTATNAESNAVELLDAKGAVISDKWGTTFEDNAGFIRFLLGKKGQEPLPKTLSIHFDEIGDRKGNWKLQVPITMAKATAATTVLPVNQTQVTKHGLKMTLHQIVNTPTTTRIELETQWTEAAKKQLEQEAKKLTGKTTDPDYAPFLPYQQYMLGYYYEEADGSKGKERRKERSHSIDRYGHFRWIMDDDPLPKGKAKTLVINSFHKAIPYDMSVTFHPDELNKKPVIKQVGEDIFTVKGIKLEKDEFSEKQQMVMEVEVLSKDISDIYLPWWIAQDGQGTTYRARRSTQSTGPADQSGRERVTYKFWIVDSKSWKEDEIDKLPEKLTLRLDAVQKKYPLEWRIPVIHP